MTKTKKESQFPKEIQELITKGLMTTGDDPDLIIKFLPFGIPKFDGILGGGLPMGNTSVFYGPFSSGKTLLALMLTKKAQDDGHLCAFIDAEQSFNPEWALKHGVDLESLLVSQPKTGERAVDLIVALLQTKQVGLIVVDSLAALVPTVVAEEDMEKGTMGRHAQLVTRAMMRMLANNAETAILCLNHVRPGIGQYAQEYPPGGKAQTQYSMTMCRVARSGWIRNKKNKEHIGFEVRIEVKKTKTSRQDETVTIPFLYDDSGLDVLTVNLDYAIELGAIPARVPFYDWKEIKYQGKEALRQFFVSNAADYEELLKEIAERERIRRTAGAAA